MTIHVIKMPDLGEGIAEVELVAWHVAPGDIVAEDQVLADGMTDKATIEIPSPVSGRVLTLGGEVGQLMAVGSELIRIELSDAGEAAAQRNSATVRADSSTGSGQGTQSVSQPHRPFDTSGQTALREQYRAAPAAHRSEASAAAAQRHPIASPAVRARAWELGIDLQAVAASGSAGRIMQADLDAYVASGAPRALHLPSSSPSAPTAPPPTPRVAAGSETTHSEKIVGLRRKIAIKMQEAKRRIPHFAYVEEIDVTELEALRTQLNATWGTARAHLTLLPFLIRAVALAAREYPQVNARFDDEAGVLTRHDALHVGIATHTPAGLMVPVLRDAQAHDLWANAAEITRLAEAARSGKAVRDELSGSTITVTSLGRQGGIMSTPIINHPEVAIVGVNRMVLRPMIREGAVVPRQMMNLSSSFDHRVVDGAVGAAFVQRLREQLEHPATLFIE